MQAFSYERAEAAIGRTFLARHRQQRHGRLQPHHPRQPSRLRHRRAGRRSRRADRRAARPFRRLSRRAGRTRSSCASWTCCASFRPSSSRSRIVAATGPSLANIVVVIGLVDAPIFARVVRAEVLSLRPATSSRVGGRRRQPDCGASSSCTSTAERDQGRDGAERRAARLGDPRQRHARLRRRRRAAADARMGRHDPHGRGVRW